MPEAFMVTRGDYSDYRVLAVFSTREGAEKYAAYFPSDRWNPASIEPIGLDEGEKYPKGKLRYSIQFDCDGNSQVNRQGPDDGQEDVRPYGDKKTMVTYCWAKDEEHAAKIANERRVQVIAANAWETDFRVWRAKQGG